ncbi:MAG: hypothetical protein HGA71_14990 [Azonexaceae bacterium]|nr:hypothetical protein [Azonexaceae bacterium]
MDVAHRDQSRTAHPKKHTQFFTSVVVAKVGWKLNFSKFTAVAVRLTSAAIVRNHVVLSQGDCSIPEHLLSS